MRPYDLDREAPGIVNAYYLALAAEAAYLSEPGIEDGDLDEAFPQILILCAGHVFGFLAANKDHALLSFRGTDEESNLLGSLSYGQRRWGAGRAHGAMADSVESVWTPLLAGLYDTGAMEKTLWLTGHSLGGAYAVLCAARLEAEGFEPFFAATFGAPRVLDPAAAQSFETPLYRFENNEDLVPAMPWPSLADSYVHVGERKFLLASGRIAETRHSDHLARRIDRAESIGEGILPAGFLHDHPMERYLEKLGRHLS